MQKKVILTERQQIQIDNLIKHSKFNRLVKGLLADRTTNADTKAKMVYELKKKIFDNVEPRSSRFK